MKKRSGKEVNEIAKAAADGKSIPEICAEFGLSETSLYRILGFSRTGQIPQPKEKPSHQKIERLEKKLLEREREISLLRAALKKS